MGRLSTIVFYPRTRGGGRGEKWVENIFEERFSSGDKDACTSKTRVKCE